MVLDVKKLLIVIVSLCVLACLLWFASTMIIGAELDSHNGVTVHYNGMNIAQNHGKHFAHDGYYYGRKWQCVEFVKRYYYEHLNHSMPDGWGNAKDFFDPDIGDGKLNRKRGLKQYTNGGASMPLADDLIVLTQGKYGHVAIVTEVGNDYVEIVQQNVFLSTRKRLPLKDSQVGAGDDAPAGWLRLKKSL